MELRDQFAIAALQSLIACPEVSAPNYVLAASAYDLADEMLIAREHKSNKKETI